MIRFRLRRRVFGIRLAAFALVSVLGAAVSFVAPISLVVLLFMASDALGRDPGPLTALVMFGALGLMVLCMHTVGVGLERAWKLRTSWGQLSIGRDGLSWDGWVLRSFVPWGAVAGAKALADGLRIARQRGAKLLLGVDAPRDVEAALSTALEAARVEPLEVPVALAKAAPEAWLESVRAMARDDYRSGVPHDVLVRVLEHPASPPLARVGAARALATRDPAKVRVVIDDLADEETAKALEQALVKDPDPATIRRLAARW